MITAKYEKSLELNSEYFGVSLEKLMENAGKGVAEYVLENFSELKKKKIFVFCGTGNNGGDGYVTARNLIKFSSVEIFSVTSPRSNLARKKYQEVREYTSEINSPEDLPKEEPDIIIDAIFGTGIKGEVREPFKSVIEWINRSKAKKISIDVPSGVNPDTGIGHGVKPDLIISLHDKKKCGGDVIVDIGIPSDAEKFCGPGDVFLALPKREKESHKGDNGILLVIGGSGKYVGAPIMSSLAALRTGTDLVFLAAPERVANTASKYLDMITVPLRGDSIKKEHFAKLSEHIQKSDAILVGPGLGESHETKKLISELLKAKKKIILDADSLKMLPKNAKATAFTPHKKEFEIMSGKKPTAENVKVFAKNHGVVLLKSSEDLISDGKRIKKNLTGNEGMSVGGTGDVLSGILAGLVSQGSDPFWAACAAAFINGKIGDELKEEYGYGFIASDFIERIPKVLYGLRH